MGVGGVCGGSSLGPPNNTSSVCGTGGTGGGVSGPPSGVMEKSSVCVHPGQSHQQPATVIMADELDTLMDISMEIASNKRMKKEYIKPFRLTFKDNELEKKVSNYRSQFGAYINLLRPIIQV